MEERSVGTHDGPFHADEVTACALLSLFDLIDQGKIYRTRDDAVLNNCEYVCDVGGIYDPSKKRFDHHQVEYDGKLSSAGMILEYLHQTKVLDDSLFDHINKSLIIGVDAVDNGQITHPLGHCSYSGVISNFVPSSYDSTPEQFDAAFFEALDFAYGHLSRLLERYAYARSCKGKVKQAMQEGKDLLIFSEAMPWMDAFFEFDGENHPAQFLIMPAGTHWKLRGIPPNERSKMQVRHPLPEKWAGLLADELKQVSGIDGAIFCHKGQFISIWETKEDAIKAYEMVKR